MLEAAEVPVVLHCFGSVERLDDALERGYLVSFAGNVAYPRPRICARRPAGCPTTAFWPRPTRRTWPRRRTADARTSRPT